MCGECVLALQAAAQNLDGGGLVVSGAQVAQARRGCASDCGAAAQEQRARVWASAGGGAVKSSGAAAAWSGEQAARERRRSGVRARVQGGGFARGKNNSETDAWGPRRG